MMKLSQIAEVEGLDPEWTNQPERTSVDAIRKKMLSLDHQADLMMSKLETWTKVAKGKVFTVTGIKTGLKLPKQVEKSPRGYIAFTLVHSNPNIVTKVYVVKDDSTVIVPVRALINRHNELTNARADMEGRLAKLQSESMKRSREASVAARDKILKV